MSAEALRTGESKGSPIHTMQRGEKKIPVWSLATVLLTQHLVENNSGSIHLGLIFVSFCPL